MIMIKSIIYDINDEIGTIVKVMPTSARSTNKSPESEFSQTEFFYFFDQTAKVEFRLP